MYRISFFFVTSDISNYRSFIRAVPKPLKKNVLKRGRNPIFNSLRPSKNSVILNFNYQIITSICYPYKLYVKSLFISGERDCCLFKMKRNSFYLFEKEKKVSSLWRSQIQRVTWYCSENISCCARLHAMMSRNTLN